jgi:hypothetical protein
LPMSAAALPAKANICRNCGAPAPGAFCPSCGQETDTRLPTVRQFMHDATGRLIAFDGRLWRTLFALVFKPGIPYPRIFRRPSQTLRPTDTPFSSYVTNPFRSAAADDGHNPLRRKNNRRR